MINKRLIWTVIFNRFTHPCVVVDVLADVWTGTVINMLADVMIDSLADVVIVLEFVVPAVSYVVEDVLTDVAIDVLDEMAIDVLTDMSIDALAVIGRVIDAMTGVSATLEFAKTTTLGESIIFC